MKNRNLPYILIALPILGNGTIQTFILGERTGTITIDVIVIILGLYFYYSEKRINSQYNQKMRLLFPLFLYFAYFSYNILSVGRGFNFDHDTRRWISEIVLPLVMYLITIRVCMRDGDKKIRNLLINLLFIESLMSIVGVILSGSIQSMAAMSGAGESIARDYEQYATGNAGSIVAFGAGTFEHSNLLGAFIVLLMPQMLIRWLQVTHKGYRQIVIFIIILIAILLTFSRSTWLGFSLTIFLTVLMGKVKGKKWPIIFAGTIFLSIIYLSPLLQARLSDVSTIDVRDEVRYLGMNLFLQHPWFGYGLAFFASIKGDSLLFNPHNDYVTRLLGGGVFGVIAFMIPFIIILVVSLRNWHETSNTIVKMESLMLFITCLSYMILMAVNPIQELFFLVPIVFAIYEVKRNRFLKDG